MNIAALAMMKKRKRAEQSLTEYIGIGSFGVEG